MVRVDDPKYVIMLRKDFDDLIGRKDAQIKDLMLQVKSLLQFKASLKGVQSLTHDEKRRLRKPVHNVS